MTSRAFGVMTVDTGASSLRLEAQVAMRDDARPRLAPLTTGTPDMPRARVSSMTWRIVMSGDTVIGSAMTPLSNFLTCADFARLRVDRHVLVDDAHAAFLRHGDGEARLGHGVHGRRKHRQPETDVAA